MRIVQLTEGAGDRYTSTGIRDQALVAALRRMGHRVTYMRLWDNLPQEEEECWSTPIFMHKEAYAFRRYSTLYKLFPNALPSVVLPYLSKRSKRKIDKLTPARKIELNTDLLTFNHPFLTEEYNALLAAIKHSKPEVICLSSLRFACLIPRLRQDVNIPVVATLTGSLCNWIRSGALNNSTLGKLLGDNLKQSSAILSPSSYLAQTAADVLHIPRDSITVNHTGFMLNFYSARELIPAAPAIGFIGKPSEANGISHVIKAMQMLVDKGLSFRFLATGNMTDKEHAKFQKYLAPIFKQAPDNLQVLPNLSIKDKTHMLEQLTLLTLPSIQKAFGNPIIEAMAAGVPVVVPNAGPYPELVRDYQTGLLYDHTSTEAYAAALEKMLFDRELNKTCGHNSRSDAINTYSSERMAGDVMSILKTLV